VSGTAYIPSPGETHASRVAWIARSRGIGRTEAARVVARLYADGTVQVPVTQADIDNGTPRELFNSPLARALRLTFPGAERAVVTDHVATVYFPDRTVSYWYSGVPVTEPCEVGLTQFDTSPAQGESRGDDGR
jgi:hypothetical protein